MQQSDFIAHLDRKGVLRADQAADSGLRARRGLVFNDTDWVGLTRLTASAFADELAAFYRCDRVQRTDLLGHRFAGAELSPRFLRGERLFPYKHPSGTVTLAIARPIEEDTIRAAEIALRQPVAVVVATGEDIEAALATIFDTEQANVAAAAEVVAPQDDLDDLRDLARGAPVVRTG